MKRYLLRFRGDNVEKPIISGCVIETGALIDILRADANENVLIRIPKEKEHDVVAFFEEKGVEIRPLNNAVVYDKDLCIDCGACISLCPTGALSFDKNKKLVYDEEKCILCKNCLDGCPRKALKLPDFI
jgi:L-aspartate semialdehyde sulfurtransferase ferredoxin